MPNESPSYTDNPTFDEPLPTGFKGTGYGEAVIGILLTLDKENGTEYFRDLGKCLNPRTPALVHEYTVITGAQANNRHRTGEVTVNVSFTFYLAVNSYQLYQQYCGSKSCCNNLKKFGLKDFRKIPVPANFEAKVARRYSFWLEAMHRLTLAKHIREHFGVNNEPLEVTRSSPARPLPSQDSRCVQSSPARPLKRKALETLDVVHKKLKSGEHKETGKHVQSIVIDLSDDSDNESDPVAGPSSRPIIRHREVEVIDVSDDANSDSDPVADPPPRPIGSAAGKWELDDLIQACERLKNRVSGFQPLDKRLESALTDLRDELNDFL